VIIFRNRNHSFLKSNDSLKIITTDEMPLLYVKDKQHTIQCAVMGDARS
jgi:hypothetical protein